MGLDMPAICLKQRPPVTATAIVILPGPPSRTREHVR